MLLSMPKAIYESQKQAGLGKFCMRPYVFAGAYSGPKGHLRSTAGRAEPCFDVEGAALLLQMKFQAVHTEKCRKNMDQMERFELLAPIIKPSTKARTRSEVKKMLGIASERA
jgi:hypothetical protein